MFSVKFVPSIYLSVLVYNFHNFMLTTLKPKSLGAFGVYMGMAMDMDMDMDIGMGL